MTLLRRLGTWISNKVYVSEMRLALTVIGLGMAGAGGLIFLNLAVGPEPACHCRLDRIERLLQAARREAQAAGRQGVGRAELEQPLEQAQRRQAQQEAAERVRLISEQWQRRQQRQQDLAAADAAVPAAAPSTEVCDAAAEPAAELVPR